MNKIEEALASHPFLQNMDIAYLRYLADCSQMMKFDSGQFLLRQGAAAREFYLIRSGRICIELFSGEGGPVVIQTLGAGEVLGWSWLIPPYQWRFDARAVDAGEAIAVKGDVLKAAFTRFPEFGHEIMQRFIRVIAERLEAERLKLVNLYAAHS
jgi:CRP/FNR family cyclic AMP-dependent transcriptional regulator